MKKTTTVFGRSFNREFLQSVMDTIFSFHDTEHIDGVAELRITIQKNLYMGAIWLKFRAYPHDGGMVLRKRRYDATRNWHPLPCTRAHRYLREACKWAEPDERKVLEDAVKRTAPDTILTYPYEYPLIGGKRMGSRVSVFP